MANQDDRSIGRSSAVNDPLRDNKAFSGLEIHTAIFQIDDEVSVEHEEELIVVVVLVPMIFALHDAETDDGDVDLAEGLIVPAVLARTNQGRDVHDTQRWKLDVEVRGVWKRF